MKCGAANTRRWAPNHDKTPPFLLVSGIIQNIRSSRHSHSPNAYKQVFLYVLFVTPKNVNIHIRSLQVSQIDYPMWVLMMPWWNCPTSGWLVLVCWCEWGQQMAGVKTPSESWNYLQQHQAAKQCGVFFFSFWNILEYEFDGDEFNTQCLHTFNVALVVRSHMQSVEILKPSSSLILLVSFCGI